MENAHLPPTLSGEGYSRFSSPNYVENNRFNGFFLTVSTGRSFCTRESRKKPWDTVGEL
jgi:hypothetical protein